MVVRMRANRSKTGKRRSHQSLLYSKPATCACGASRLNHRACPGCGKYNGRIVIDMIAKVKKQTRRDKRREKALRAAGVNKDAIGGKDESKVAS